MKKLLSAIWAKALAFLLTPLAGVAAVNGVSEVTMYIFTMSGVPTRCGCWW